MAILSPKRPTRTAARQVGPSSGRRLWRLAPALALLLLLAKASALGQPPRVAEEYQVKAAFLFNFARFVEWPKEAFISAEAPLIFGLIGEDPSGGQLKSTLDGKIVQNRPILFRHYRSGQIPAEAHILFIPRSEKNLPDLAEKLGSWPVLTVADEMPRALRQGAMVNFLIQDQRVRFEINNAQAESAGLRINSRLLSLAVRVEQHPKE